MELITRKILARTAAMRWKYQYCKDGAWEDDDDAKLIYTALSSLFDPSPEEVNSIIGNDSWTACPACSECGFQKDAVIRCSDTLLDEYSPDLFLCRDCTTRFSQRWEERDAIKACAYDAQA